MKSCNQDSLPLFNLTPVHQKMVLSKLHYTDYFRMKQTCKAVHELTENMTKFVDNDDIFYTDIRKKKGTVQLVLTLGNRDESKWLGSDGSRWYEFPSGLRLNIFKIPDDFEGDFDLYCDLLKRYRLSAKSIIMGRMGEPNEYQLKELIRILNPKIVDVPRSHYCPLRYEAVFDFTSFERITANVPFPESDDLTETVLKFFPITKKLELMLDTRKLTPEQMHKFLTVILQSLISNVFPNLEGLDLCGPLPVEFPIEKAPKMLQDYNPTIEECPFQGINSEIYINYDISLPYITVDIGPYKFKINYERPR